MRDISPPYWAVIFSSVHADDLRGYEQTSRRMVELAKQQPGFLGVESAREAGFGITVSYWQSPQAIEAWRLNGEHLEAQCRGRDEWYAHFTVRVARVERAHGSPGFSSLSPSTGT